MSGYIGPAPVPQATQTRQTFTATSGQTSFATAGYVAGGQFIQVYLNGVLLKLTDDYTAENGSDILLTSGAATGDIFEFISFADFTVNNQNFTGGLTVDNDGSTVLTVDRATSDGTIIDLQKSGSSVGSVGIQGTGLYMDGESGHSGFRLGGNNISPRDSGADSDGVVSLGQDTLRFNNLYLSGAVVFGDAGGSATSSSNALDSYEEGTWQPVAADNTSGGNTSTTGQGFYTKIGRLVVATCDITNINTTGLTLTNTFSVQGLPFANNGAVRSTATLQVNLVNNGDGLFAHLSENGTSFVFKYNDDSKNNAATGLLVSDIKDDQADMFGITLVYHTAT